jgi:hypothetical protein
MGFNLHWGLASKTCALSKHGFLVLVKPARIGVRLTPKHDSVKQQGHRDSMSKTWD